MTTRRLMVLVAMIAIALGGMIERRCRFQRLAVFHVQEGLAQSPSIVVDLPRPGAVPFRTPYQEWHFTLAAKYHRAARRPWLPVPPDPPEPNSSAVR